MQAENINSLRARIKPDEAAPERYTEYSAAVSLTCMQYTGVSLDAVFSAHSCPRSLLPRETKYSVNFASAYEEHTRVSPSVLHPSVSIPRYLCSATIFILCHTAPPPRSLSRRPLCHIFAVFLPRYPPPSWSSARRFVSPSCADLPPCSSVFSFFIRRLTFLFSFPLSVSLRARVLPPLVFVIVVSSSSSFARSLTLYALFSRKLPDSRDDLSTFLYSFRSSRTPLTFCAPRRFV